MAEHFLRHFRRLSDLSRDELISILDRALLLKSFRRHGGAGELPLAGKSLAMIFRKSSTRTRVSFEVGMHELGGHAVFLSDRDSQMGRGESLADTARVLSGYVDGIMIRTFDQEEIEEIARHSTVPVINGLSDLLHPCQLLADLQTIMESFDLRAADLTGVSVAWIGDGNNVANSWINAAAALGFRLAIAAPEGYGPDPGILEAALAGGASVTLFESPREAVEGASVVTTDVWASMGQEDEADAREKAFAGYQVDEALMERADEDAIFLHCLPAHRGEEVSATVIDGPRSRVFPEAENRLHAQKALMVHLMGSDEAGEATPEPPGTTSPGTA